MKYLFIIILLYCAVNLIHSLCTWTDTIQKPCAISCSDASSETIPQIMNQLQDRWNDRDGRNCHESGIKLKLSLYFDGFIMPENWFTAGVNVTELEMSMTACDEVAVNAFNVPALNWVKKLVFTSTPKQFTMGMFNGLEKLETLNILQVNSVGYQLAEMGVLSTLKELQEFTFIQQSAQYTSRAIHGFTGAAEMPKLTHVKITFDLGNTLTVTSFQGLVNVKHLDISDCKILTILDGTFDAISNTIETLNLNNNLFTTLPGVFDLMLVRDTNIHLNGIKWACECELMPFKVYLIYYPDNFIGQMICNSPSTHYLTKIIDANFCPTTTVTTTTFTTTTTIEPTTQPTTEPPTQPTTEPTTQPTTESPLTTTIEPPEEILQECFQPGETNVSSKIVIKTPTQNMSVYKNEYNELVLQIEKPLKNSYLLWFTSDNAQSNENKDINCLINYETNIRIGNLVENLAYTFCLMDPMEKTVSPLDCISYTHQRSDITQPWLYENSKGIVIGIMIFACIFTFLSGLAVGLYWFKFTNIALQKNRSLNSMNNVMITDVLKETFNTAMIRMKDRSSVLTTDSFSTKRTTNTTVEYSLDNSYKPPPLPARPSCTPHEEPIYATVEDTEDYVQKS